MFQIRSNVTLFAGWEEVSKAQEIAEEEPENKEDELEGGKVFVLKNRMTGRLALKESAVSVSYDPVSKRIYSPQGGPNVKYFWEVPQREFDSTDDLPF